MPMILWVACGGALGASARYLVSVGAGKLFGMNFPWGTFIVNIVGSFLMGAVVVLIATKWSTTLEMRAFLMTGILGGFTTFSAFSLDFITLYERKEHMLAFAYAAGTVGFSLAAIALALYLVRL